MQHETKTSNSVATRDNLKVWTADGRVPAGQLAGHCYDNTPWTTVVAKGVKTFLVISQRLLKLETCVWHTDTA